MLNDEKPWYESQIVNANVQTVQHWRLNYIWSTDNWRDYVTPLVPRRSRYVRRPAFVGKDEHILFGGKVAEIFLP